MQLRERLSSMWHWAKEHKYKITIIVFLVYIALFDHSSFAKRVRVGLDNRALRKEIAELNAEYQKDSLRIQELTDDKKALEKYAREKYGMKKPDEVVFIMK